MSPRKKLWLIFLGIIVLAVLAGLVDWPKGPDINWWKFKRELKVYLGLDLQGGASLVYEADTSQIADADKAEALDGVRDVIERRINAFGVSEPVVQTNKIGDNYRVIVELPGITDINKAIKQIGETPLLEFKEQKTGYTEEEKSNIQKINEENKKKAEEVLSKALVGEDFAQLAKDNSQDSSNKDKGGDLGCFAKGEMVEKFEKAAFEEAPVGQVYDQLVETKFGWHILKVNEKKTEGDKEKVCAQSILIRKLPEEPPLQYVATGLSGKNLKRAQVVFDQQTNLPQVSLQFDEEGKNLFAEITERNVGKPVAIYLDESPISIPTVEEPIKDGQAVITGDFNLEEAKQLARRLNAGALPVPITLVNQRQVGPTLGQLSVERSLLAGVVGVIILALFMIIYYRWPGFLACLALGIYTLVVLAIFKLWPVTLTLAGIAGFILSVGMAVDANVLIFERMKEELRQGKPRASAIDDGFRRAWLSIRDSNVSSLITCLILYWFGTSMIRGFAITLAIGILISMFSAITVTKTFLRLFYTPRNYVRLH